jgi:DNA-binding response OmpR family regulator
MNDDGRILVVDDDPDIGTMIKMILEYNGYKVMVMERADGVKDVLQQNGIRLLIMDMLLSGFNGMEICGELKKDDAVSDIPILMISAHPNAKEICLQAGADEFISKPFDMQELLSKIRQLLQKN